MINFKEIKREATAFQFDGDVATFYNRSVQFVDEDGTEFVDILPIGGYLDFRSPSLTRDDKRRLMRVMARNSLTWEAGQ